MADIWVISDTHFNHDNILKFEDKAGKPCRDFVDVEDMNETMIANWNSVVKQEAFGCWQPRQHQSTCSTLPKGKYVERL